MASVKATVFVCCTYNSLYKVLPLYKCKTSVETINEYNSINISYSAFHFSHKNGVVMKDMCRIHVCCSNCDKILVFDTLFYFHWDYGGRKFYNIVYRDVFCLCINYVCVVITSVSSDKLTNFLVNCEIWMFLKIQFCACI